MATRTKRKRVSARSRAENHQSGWTSKAIKIPDGVKLFEVDGKPRVLDFIPYRVKHDNPYADPGDIHPERTFFVHKNVGAQQASYCCPLKMANKRCPICEERNRLRSQMEDPNSKESKEILGAMSPKERQLFLLYDLKDRETGLQLWDISFHLFGKQMDERIKASDPNDEYEFYSDLEEGFQVRLGFTEKSYRGKKFYETSSIDFKPRKQNYTESLADEVPCLDDILIIPSYDELKDAFFETAADEEIDEEIDDMEADEWDENDEPVKPAPKKRKEAPAPKKTSVKKAKPKAKAEDEEDEKPAPKKKRGRPKKAAPPPEPEDELDSDIDDDGDDEIEDDEIDDDDDTPDDVDDDVDDDDDWDDEDWGDDD